MIIAIMESLSIRIESQILRLKSMPMEPIVVITTKTTPNITKKKRGMKVVIMIPVVYKVLTESNNIMNRGLM